MKYKIASFNFDIKYPLEILSLFYWLVLMATFVVMRLYIQRQPVTGIYIFDQMKLATIMSLVYYIFQIKKEQNKLKTK
ncbi:MAG: hypothetical protein WCO78_02125 [Candidatus Roizmanbacteria bacterium]